MPRMRVAVEDSLHPVRERLQAAGYEVVALGPDVGAVRAIVISGLDRNVAGEERIAAPVPVIDADGRSPDEVLALVARLP